MKPGPAKDAEPALSHEALKTRGLAAQAIAREAGQLACRFLADRSQLQIELKGPQDFVGNADRAVERLNVECLSAAFPGDAVVGEEAEADQPAGAGTGIWMIDPIDGTANFVRNRPEWCVSIGFLHMRRRSRFDLAAEPRLLRGAAVVARGRYGHLA